MQRLEVSGAVRTIYGSLGVKRLIIVRRDATQSSLFIILQVHSTCFGCQPSPSPGVHKTVITVSGTGHTVKYKGILLERYIIYSVTRNRVVGE